MDSINRDANQIDQKKLLLESLFSHKLDFVKEYFRSKDISFSYRKDILYSKLNEGIDDGTFSLPELTELLDKIEEFGNQHIYLFNCNMEYIKILREPTYIKGKLRNRNLENLYNNENFIILPNEPTLTSVFHNNNILKFGRESAIGCYLYILFIYATWGVAKWAKGVQSLDS